MISNTQIINEAMEDMKNPERTQEALENIVMLMTERAEIDLKNDLFDVGCDIDKARAVMGTIYETYFSYKLNDARLTSIANSHHDIGLMLSTAISLLHDAVEAFQKYGIY